MNPRLRRSIMTFDQQLAYKPLPENRQGAFCLICRQPSDSEQLVDEARGQRNFARVLVKCHGEEELRTFEFGSEEWDHTDLNRAMQRSAWFDPVSHMQTHGIPNNGEVKDSDEV